MQQIKDIYFFNLNNFATSLIINNIQIKIILHVYLYVY